MIELTQLKQILFFQGLSDNILKEICGIARIETFEEETELFKQDQDLSNFYMLLKGKIFLNTRSPRGESITLDEVTPGHSFGLSSIIGEATSAFTAIAAEKSEVIIIKSKDIQELFKNNMEVGYLITLRVVQLFKSRMHRHTRQFITSLANHPEIKKNLTAE